VATGTVEGQVRDDVPPRHSPRVPVGARRPTSWFRPDVDGLRALAIVLVVLFHARVPGFHAGFTGVDVFFVISGYLITRKLLDEAVETRRVRLLGFWAKRIRRLVPAMALMVAVTLAASVLVLLVIDLAEVARQGAAALLYVSNFLFASEAGDYFGTDLERSPFLHTWSLGVEEQFYILWPILVAAACLIGRRRPQALKPLLYVVFAGLLVASLAVCISLTDRGSAWAFYGLPARAWEFAAAGLLAALPVPKLARHARLSTAVAVAGLATIGAGLVLIPGAAGYPGRWALFPVVGTLLVIAAGEGVQRDTRVPPVASVLSASPMQSIGRVSYSWYLWHWPFVVLAVAWLDNDRVPVRLTAVLLSLPVAYVTYSFYERPVRFSPWLTRSHWRTLGAGVALTALVLAGVTGVTRYAEARTTGAGLDAQLAAIREQRERASCNREVSSSGGVDYCEGGDLDSDVTVVLIGDSHAAHWKDALAEVADDLGIRLADHWRSNCPAIGVRVSHPTADLDTRCTRYHEQLRTLIEDLEPSAVIVSQSDGYLSSVRADDGSQPDQAGVAALWGNAYDAFLSSLLERGITPAVILDNPGMPEDPVECLARERKGDACAVPLTQMKNLGNALERAEREVLSGHERIAVFDPVPLICDSQACHVEIDGEIVYADTGHLTIQFTASQRHHLERLIGEALNDDVNALSAATGSKP